MFSLIDPPMQHWTFTAFGEQANDPAIAGPLADPDNDGLPNVVERALGQSPLSASQGPQSSVTDGYLSLEFFEAIGTSDLTYTVKASADLMSWSGANLGEVQRTPEPGGTRVKVRDQMPIAGTPRRFLRLEVGF